MTGHPTPSRPALRPRLGRRPRGAANGAGACRSLTTQRVRWLAALGALGITAAAPAQEVTEAQFRAALGVQPAVQLRYQDFECQPLEFAAFAQGMSQPGVSSEVIRAPDGSSITVSLHRRGGKSCPSPYGRVTQMPDFDLKDLQGRRVTHKDLRGKPTLMNFYFADCKPCILEVAPLNRFAAVRKDLTVIAMTFDDPVVAAAFVKRYGFRWRIVPGAREFIDRMAVNRYPLMALFDSQGRLLGTRAGGASDELEAATVEPALRRWVDSLLR